MKQLNNNTITLHCLNPGQTRWEKHRACKGWLCHSSYADKKIQIVRLCTDITGLWEHLWQVINAWFKCHISLVLHPWQMGKNIQRPSSLALKSDARFERGPKALEQRFLKRQNGEQGSPIKNHPCEHTFIISLIYKLICLTQIVDLLQFSMVRSLLLSRNFTDRRC